MNISGWFWKVLIALTIVTGLFFTQYLSKLLIVLTATIGLFFLDKLLDQKTKGADGTKWRIIFGVIQFSFALLAFILVKGYTFYKGRNLILIGVVILATGGIGEIILGILNAQAEKKNTTKF
jgi:hypothetical protein